MNLPGCTLLGTVLVLAVASPYLEVAAATSERRAVAALMMQARAEKQWR